MKTTVEIEWDGPEIQEWLCADNISLALHAYCHNTKFKVREYTSEVVLARKIINTGIGLMNGKLREEELWLKDCENFVEDNK